MNMLINVRKKGIIPGLAISVDEYAQILNELKAEVQQSQVRTVLSVNSELIKLYWALGKTIVRRQEAGCWGSGVIELFAKELHKAFPGMVGFSRTNVFNMRAFYLTYAELESDEEPIQNLPIFKIPWTHNIILLNKLSANKQRLWYAQRAFLEAWSRRFLEANIKSKLYNRAGKALNNFKMTLSDQQAALAQQSLKDPYCFDWLPLADGHAEKVLEKGLIDHIQQLLLELGQGFAFVGRQVSIEVSGNAYFIDLLFYHYKLKCFMVVELKARSFDPRDAGQINFYLSAVDEILRGDDDKPTIGLLLCQTKDKLTVEYALRGVGNPIGVASYETMILEKLPKEFKSSLPSVEEIEAGLEKMEKSWN